MRIDLLRKTLCWSVLAGAAAALGVAAVLNVSFAAEGKQQQAPTSAQRSDVSQQDAPDRNKFRGGHRYRWRGGRGAGGTAQHGHGRGGGGHQGRGPGHGRAGRGADPAFEADRATFHFLLDQREKIRRRVVRLSDGVQTLTESDDPKVAKAIQEHVAAMHRRLTKPDPIRMRDPLFAAIFRGADKITMEIEKTERGVRVTETSSDPFVVKLIQAHAAVVSRFLEVGYPEARANHEVPVTR
jgi:hypothetical protein